MHTNPGLSGQLIILTSTAFTPKIHHMKFSLSTVLLVLFVALAAQSLLAQTPETHPEWFDLDGLPQHMTADEELRRHEIGMNFVRSAPPEDVIRNIAEFERNEAVLIRFPLGIPLELVALMAEHVTVITLVANQSQQNQATNAFTSAGVIMENVEFVQVPTNSYWTRDYGPFYIIDGNNELSLVDFIYNRPRPQDDAVNAFFADHLDVSRYAMDVVHTGGNYMSTGQGSAASTDLIWEENGNNQTLVMERMYDYMRIETYHTTIDPQDSYLKHIDTWAKFLDVDKIIIAEVPPGHPQYTNHELVADYYENALSPWGTPFQVFRVQTPNGQPYSNSLILNERVYVPISGSNPSSPPNAAALQVYEDAMPGYEIIGVPFVGGSGWLSTDALHCRTKEVPDRGLLSIQHVPVTEIPSALETFELYADITAYSGTDLIEDELFLIYRSNDAPFDTLALNHMDGNTFSASIPLSSEAQEINYYFSASDASGRTETWPLIGPEGARSFTLPPFVSTDADPTGETFRLEAVYPNPTSGPITVRYSTNASATIHGEVFDVMGRRVLTVEGMSQSAGRHTQSVDTSQLAPGTYIFRMTVDGMRHSQRFVVAK